MCPHDAVPLGAWCVQCGAWRAFLLAALVMALAGCKNLPAAAYPVHPDDLAAVHDVWVSVGHKPCLPIPALFVYVASDAERVEWCDRDPPPGACLAHARVRPMRRVWLAVVPPEDPTAWRHEALHMFEACVLGGHDYYHSGPQWTDAARRDAGVP